MRFLHCDLQFYLVYSLVLKITPHCRKRARVQLITGKAEQGISLKRFCQNKGNKNNSVGLPINALLWRASLDIMSTIPFR